MKILFSALASACLLAVFFAAPARAQMPGGKTLPAGGEQTGRKIAPSHAERTLQREWASTNAEPATVTLATN